MLYIFLGIWYVHWGSGGWHQTIFYPPFYFGLFCITILCTCLQVNVWLCPCVVSHSPSPGPGFGSNILWVTLWDSLPKLSCLGCWVLCLAPTYHSPPDQAWWHHSLLSNWGCWYLYILMHLPGHHILVYLYFAHYLRKRYNHRGSRHLFSLFILFWYCVMT